MFDPDPGCDFWNSGSGLWFQSATLVYRGRVTECLVRECLERECLVRECLITECLNNWMPSNWMPI